MVKNQRNSCCHMGCPPMIGDLHFHRGYSLRLQESKPLKNNGIISLSVSRRFLSARYAQALRASGGPCGNGRMSTACAELSRAALDQRSAGLTGWAMVLPWQRIGNGMVRVVQRVA